MDHRVVQIEFTLINLSKNNLSPFSLFRCSQRSVGTERRHCRWRTRRRGWDKPTLLPLEVSAWMTRTRWSLLTWGITASWNGSEVRRVAQCWPVATEKEIDLISWNIRQMWSSTKRPTVSSSAIEIIVEWHVGHVGRAPEAEKRSSTTSIVSD